MNFVTLNAVEQFLQILVSTVTLLGSAAGAYAMFKRRKSESTVDDLVLRSNLTQAEKDRVISELRGYRSVARGLLSITICAAILAVAYTAVRPNSRSALATYLNDRDPSLFYQDSEYGIARVFANKTDLNDHSSFRQDIEKSTKTFDFFANSAPALREAQEAIRGLVKKGVTVRIVISDPRSENKENFDRFASAVQQNPGEARVQISNVLKLLIDLQSNAESDRTTYPGSIEIRLNRRLLLHTLWIVDGNDSDRSIGHVGVHFYQGYQHWPCFRVSKDGKNLVSNLVAEYKCIWDQAMVLDRKDAKLLDDVLIR